MVRMEAETPAHITRYFPVPPGSSITSQWSFPTQRGFPHHLSTHESFPSSGGQTAPMDRQEGRKVKHAGVSLQKGFEGVICFLQNDQIPSAEQPAAFVSDRLHLTPVAVQDQSVNLVCDFGCDKEDLKFHWVSVSTKSMCQGKHYMTKPAWLPLLQRRQLSWRLLFTVLTPNISVDICNSQCI